ncbi:MAG: hypothetical protein N2312_05925 [Dictyoglomaceae bacterium]|nr:hypothetical protein [Dictyoglomaceae bacterium]
MEKEQILKGLDSFAKLAKQDILASSTLPEKEFWEKNAQARYEKYKELYKLIQETSLDETLKIALEEYKNLKDSDDAISRGKKRALESFFILIGIDFTQI